MASKPQLRKPSEAGADLPVQRGPHDLQSSSATSARATITAIQAEYFAGPLPHPEDLAEYERICPGAADRILAMAEAQGRHRQELERQVVASNCKAQERGPVLGFTVAILTLGIGGYLAATGRELIGMATLIGALAAVVIPFIYGKRAQREELGEKRKEMSAPSSELDSDWDYSLPSKPSEGSDEARKPRHQTPQS